MGREKINTRLDRLDQLIGFLKTADVYTAGQLARLLSVSTRTLMRDLEVLKNKGFPIDSEQGRGGGVRLQSNWGIGRLLLNYHEVIDLLLSLAIMEKVGAPLFLNNLKAIRNKINASFPKHKQKQIQGIRKRILVGDLASTTILESYNSYQNKNHDGLYESFFDAKLLSINYQDEHGNNTKRIIEAQYLLLNWPIWYILAWDHLRNDTRCFRIDRISKEKILDESFRLKPLKWFEDETDMNSSIL